MGAEGEGFLILFFGGTCRLLILVVLYSPHVFESITWGAKL